MITSRISAALRREVRERAGGRCEYCLLAESESFFPHEIDHLISQKHDGETATANLALACVDWKKFKGSDIASLDKLTGQLVALFNPRTQLWADHFCLQGGEIVPLTSVGRVTERMLRLNLSDRVKKRESLIALGTYPPAI